MNIRIAKSEHILFDSKVVSIRFDLIPWAMVWDIDVPSGEFPSAPHSRAWAIFSSVSELSLPFESVRFGPGYWISDFNVNTAEDFNSYAVRFLLMQSEYGTTYLGSANIKAQSLLCLKSIREAKPDNNRNLSFAKRSALATDQDFLSAYDFNQDGN